MPAYTATAQSCANIAFIKYWGDRDPDLHLPANGSISMNLGSLLTRTRVEFNPEYPRDQLILNGTEISGPSLKRVADFLGHIRRMGECSFFARVKSVNNFPIRAGIASSASAFAALALAGTTALGLNLYEKELSRLARLGSGSACRSIPAGFVEWHAGKRDGDSFAYSLAKPDHWALVDCVAIVHIGEKEVGSIEGHLLAGTSLLQNCRLNTSPDRIVQCRRAVLERDFASLADVIELDSNLMHAVMMTSRPPLFYWQPPSLAVMQEVIRLRKSGFPCCYTLDAGPNVHVLTLQTHARELQSYLSAVPGVLKVLLSPVGGGTKLTSSDAEVLFPPD